MTAERPPPAAFRLRALVTRPRHQAGRLAARLRARGIGCLVEPMLEIEPLPWDAAAALRGRQAILLTSPNAARALARAAVAGTVDEQDQVALPSILAVGAATAYTLRRVGSARVAAAPGDAAVGLLRLVRTRLNPHRGRSLT